MSSPEKELRVLYLVKLFTQEAHAAAFYRGEIYARKLQAFRDDENAGRGDKAEGTKWLLQPKEGMKLIIRDTTGPHPREAVTITHKDLAGPVTYQSNALLDLNVFCMIGIYEGQPELKDRYEIELPERCLREFGQYAVVITAVKPFLDRVQAAAKQEGYQCEYRPVAYYNPSTFDGQMTDRQAAFSKPQDFDYQKELRIAFNTQKPGPLVLNVGDLSDISLCGGPVPFLRGPLPKPRRS